MSEDSDHSRKLAEIAFGEAFHPQELTATNATIEDLITAFEEAAQTDEQGNEFWYARDLQRLFGYAKWDNFVTVINRAREACAASGNTTSDHFAGVGKMVNLGSGAEREIDDIVLSRYASYLTAQNGDSRKQEVAFAQTYFAIQTRRQEITDKAAAAYVPLSEDERRCLLRDEIKEHNRNLASAAKNAGVREGLDFAIFQTYGYKGLYGGLDVPGIRRRKGLKANKQILDHMGSTELAANLFRATQTEEKLRREQTRGKDAANRIHFDVGAKVRQTIREIGGDMPETLPPAEDIKKVERRLKRGIGTQKGITGR
ncbi:DNA damage-inducible protein D [Mesorhizobium sp. CO1-1-8]|uniref:DNA damage-inducible protein D n=1 Tax=Mesorhizobium sp. CO1-1-8 TaxID=2876631 RepID=UPI001CD17A8B|nr:DNA damage-inducible protein D [Mesorhizobium sp. CO1-1-8]MBZ9772976.1 DNA damage-inducible protein D [Mesorhizobium sp. CO1-1-8]